MMARSKCSNQRPDTLMQDRSPPARRNHLQRTAGGGIRACPLFAQQRTFAEASGMSALCHKRTSGNFPEADALSIAGDVNLALPKGHSAPAVGVTVARRRIQSCRKEDREMTERI